MLRMSGASMSPCRKGVTPWNPALSSSITHMLSSTSCSGLRCTSATSCSEKESCSLCLYRRYLTLCPCVLRAMWRRPC